MDRPLLNELHGLVIEEQPVLTAAHDGNVVAVRSRRANVNHDSKEPVRPGTREERGGVSWRRRILVPSKIGLG